MIIFISGSINSGKSTVSKIIADRLGRTAIVELDAVRSMIVWMPLEEAIPVVIKSGIGLIRNFLDAGLSVVLPYPLSQSEYKFLTDELQVADQEIFFFTLSPSLESVSKNRGTRELTDWEKQRIDYHYKNGISNPSFGIILDTTQQSPEETAAIIIKSVKKENGT